LDRTGSTGEKEGGLSQKGIIPRNEKEDLKKKKNQIEF
jgi:hypothetical protein